MSTEETPKKVLLFITNLPDNLKIVISFLSKREFIVFVETEIKEAVAQIFEKKPDFVFLAWDHTDKKITMLPKLLEKSTTSIMVPFINKNTNDSILKFGQCPLNPKLYPPVSGPAIERLILKHSKEDIDFLSKVNQFKTAPANEQELLNIQNNLNALAASEIEEAELAPPAEPTEDLKNEAKVKMPAHLPLSIELPEELEQLTKELEDRNFNLEQDKVALSTEQIANMKSSLTEDVVEPLTNILESLENLENLEGSDEELRTGHQQTDRPSSLQQKEDISNTNFKKNFSSGYKPTNEIKTDLIIEKSSTDFSRQSSLFFKDETEKTVRHNPIELVEAELESSVLQVYCFSVVADSWCGYFVVSTKATLDYPSLDLAFTEWLKKQFPNLGTITERDYFEFNQVDVKAVQEIETMAELNENIQAHNFDFRISLFSVKPEDMKVELNDEKSYIKIFTQDIPTNDSVGFNLFLHLPENQKYLLYSLKNKPLSDDQKSRLLNKNITQMYTAINDEHVYRKFLVRKTFTRLYQLINNKLSMI